MRAAFKYLFFAFSFLLIVSLSSKGFGFCGALVSDFVFPPADLSKLRNDSSEFLFEISKALEFLIELSFSPLSPV